MIPGPGGAAKEARAGAQKLPELQKYYIKVVDSSRAAARGKQGLHVDVHVARARVISEVFQSVTGLDPPTHFRSYYGLEKTFDNCGRPFTSRTIPDSIVLLTLPISLLEGFISRHGRLCWKFSL